MAIFLRYSKFFGHFHHGHSNKVYSYKKKRVFLQNIKSPHVPVMLIFSSKAVLEHCTNVNFVFRKPYFKTLSYE